MTIKELMNILHDRKTLLYLVCPSVEEADDRAAQVVINPSYPLICEAFNNYLIDSILPVEDADSKTGYNAGLIVYLKTETKILKREN